MLSDYRKDFKIFTLKENENLIYFDNAATSMRPECVIEAVSNFYRTSNANPLRGLYRLSMKATDEYENSRAIVADFIGAARPEEVIFTRNASESINLIANTYGQAYVNEGDEVVISAMEHHSNILPWQKLCSEKHAKLVWLECGDDGVIPASEWQTKINSKTKIVSIAHVSNVFGITNPVKEIADFAHKNGAVVVVDGAQSSPHFTVSVKNLGADFFVLSGHKLLGPMGIGAVYGRYELLEKIPPFLRGGEMIEYVTRENATFAEIPHKFEAGTVNAGDAVGMAVAMKYLKEIGLEKIEENDNRLCALLMDAMKSVPHVNIIGNEDSSRHCGIVTFTIDGVHPHDISSILDTENIAIRAGHHCAQPLMQKLGVGSTARASLYFYNTEEEISRFADALKNVRKWMGISD